MHNGLSGSTDSYNMQAAVSKDVTPRNPRAGERLEESNGRLVEAVSALEIILDRLRPSAPSPVSDRGSVTARLEAPLSDIVERQVGLVSQVNDLIREIAERV